MRNTSSHSQNPAQQVNLSTQNCVHYLRFVPILTHTNITFYRNASSPNKNLTQYYTSCTKATFRSASAKTAANDGTSSLMTSSVRTQGPLMRFCREVWAQIIHFTPMAELKAFAKQDLRQDGLESAYRWKTVRRFQARRYLIIWTCINVMGTY